MSSGKVVKNVWKSVAKYMYIYGN